MQDSAAVFNDLTVLDLSSRLSGAFCARLFGDWGADVLLAEPLDGHPLRREEPQLPDGPAQERSLLHAYANANKRSVVLDPADEATFAALVRRADLVVTNAVTPDFEAFEAIKPGIVLVAITPYGLSGPRAGEPGDDLTVSALSSWAASQGDPELPPLIASHYQVGYLAGLNAFVAAVAAVYERDRTGLGQLIDASELEPLTLIAGPQMLVAEYAGAAPPRHKPDMVRGPIPCADGYVSLTLSRAHFWRDAMSLLDLPDLATDERYGSAAFRGAQRDNYSSRVEERLQNWRRWDLFDRLAELRCVVGTVLDMQDIAANPHLAAREALVDVPLPNGVTARMSGAPAKLSRTPWALRRPAPALGAHTEEVLHELDAAGVRS
jgi:crotonobetainyl-CoA:carnitine CoA-transferase CaiB-like acyl-CoA transferase